MNLGLGRPANKLQRPTFPIITGLCSNLPKRKVAGPPAALSACPPPPTSDTQTQSPLILPGAIFQHQGSCAVHQL